MKSFSTCLFLTSGIFLLLLAGCNSTKLASKKNAPNIDLTHWKVTIPTPRADGKAMEISPPEIFNYPKVETLKDFMYPDSSDGSIVFHAYPASTTANTKYSRTELREQMDQEVIQLIGLLSKVDE